MGGGIGRPRHGFDLGGRFQVEYSFRAGTSATLNFSVMPQIKAALLLLQIETQMIKLKIKRETNL